MLHNKNDTNVFVVADKVTASFFAAAGVNSIDLDSLNLERLFDVLNEVGCKLLIATEESWERLKEYIKVEEFPSVVIVPSFKGQKSYGVERIKDASDKAVGLDILKMTESE